MRGSRQLAVFMILGLIWGSEWILKRSIIAPPLAAMTFRSAFAAILISAVIASRKIRVPGSDLLLRLILSGVTMLVIPSLLIIWASNRLTPGLMTVILAMTPLIAALLEGRASGSLLLSLTGGIGGVALLASQGLSFASTQIIGASAALIAALLVGASVVYIKRKFCEVHPLVVAATQIASSAIFYAAFSMTSEGRAAFSGVSEWLPREAAIAILGSAVAYPLYYWLLRQRDSFQLTTLYWLVTAVGVVEGLTYLREAPSGRMLTGIAIVAASIGFVWRARLDDDEPVTIEITPPPHQG